MPDGTVSSFRKKRGQALSRKIAEMARITGRPISILDVGGRRDYWDNVGFEGVGKIVLLNIDPADLGRATARVDIFEDHIGDACKLDEIADNNFDLYHSNSVIEHVGGWDNIRNMAEEARRVAGAGWVQTPAFAFPLEPHFRVPFMHWFATPLRASFLCFSRSYRRQDRHKRRKHAERINLLTKGEVKLLFPDCAVDTERVLLLPKSYVVTW